jgi:DNA-binding LytR/AlgR family response regulator
LAGFNDENCCGGTVGQQLPPALFFRIHRSYIIALAAIEFIEGNLVKIGKEKLPISEGLKEALMEKMKGR